MTWNLGLLTFRDATPLRLFERAFTSWPSIDAEELRRRRDEIFEALVAPDGERLVDGLGARDPRRLAELYALLFDERSGSEPPAQSYDLSSDVVDRSIGTTFADVLVPRLPKHLVDLEGFFDGCPQADPDLMDALSREASVIAGGTAAAALVRYGLTPAGIAEAARMLSNLAARWRTADGSMGEEVVRIRTRGTSPGEGADLPSTALVDELVFTCDLARPTAERLVSWLLEVARSTPLLFRGFVVEDQDDRLDLVRSDKVDLGTAWSGEGIARLDRDQVASVVGRPSARDA